MRLPENFGQRDREAGQKRGGEDVARLGRKGSRLPEAVLGPEVDGGGLPEGIDEPVLPDTETLIALALDSLVPAARGLRKDLDDEVGSSLDVLLGDDPGPLQLAIPTWKI